MWRYGRAWINLWRGDGDTGIGYREVLKINPEWHVAPRASAGLGVQLGGGDGNTDIQLNLDVGLARFYLTLESSYWRPLMKRMLPGHWYTPPEQYQQRAAREYPIKITEETEISVSWHSGGLWWSLWHSTMEWKSSTPKWRHGHFDPIDWLLGRRAYSSDELEVVPVEVPMPEKIYAGTVRMHEDTWRRPRWPFPQRLLRATIDVPGGVPFPGKGENAWDCDDDATYSMTCVARSSEDAVGRLVASVLRDRRRHGGRNWRPPEEASA
jgi:hypothetical protein